MPILGWFCQMLPINHKPNETRPAFKEKEKVLSPQFQESVVFSPVFRDNDRRQAKAKSLAGEEETAQSTAKTKKAALSNVSNALKKCKNHASKPPNRSLTATMNIPAFYPIKNKPTPLNVTTSPV